MGFSRRLFAFIHLLTLSPRSCLTVAERLCLFPPVFPRCLRPHPVSRRRLASRWDSSYFVRIGLRSLPTGPPPLASSLSFGFRSSCFGRFSLPFLGFLFALLPAVCSPGFLPFALFAFSSVWLPAFASVPGFDGGRCFFLLLRSFLVGAFSTRFAVLSLWSVALLYVFFSFFSADHLPLLLNFPLRFLLALCVTFLLRFGSFCSCYPPLLHLFLLSLGSSFCTSSFSCCRFHFHVPAYSFRGFPSALLRSLAFILLRVNSTFSLPARDPVPRLPSPGFLCGLVPSLPRSCYLALCAPVLACVF